MRKVKIVATGIYLPKQKVTAADIAAKIGVSEKWVVKKIGVLQRHFVQDETASIMAVAAIKQALCKAQLNFSDIDALICTSGISEQTIPCTASLIKEALGAFNSDIPCFDVNSTCLSFITGLDLVSYMLDAGRFKRVILVASEISSVGLNWREKESAALLGDGACAVIVSRTPATESSCIISSSMETHVVGAHYAEIRGGGTKINPTLDNAVPEDYLFNMNGPKIYKIASQLLPGFCKKLLTAANLHSFADLKLVIPHQASVMANKLIRRKLGLSDAKFFNFIVDRGNLIAASVPMGIHEAAKRNKISRGDCIMLLGTSAGFSMGGIILEY